MENQNFKSNPSSTGDFFNFPVEARVTPFLNIKNPLGKRSKIVLPNNNAVILGEREKEYLVNLLRIGGVAYVWKHINYINGNYATNRYIDYYWMRIKKLVKKGLISLDTDKIGKGRPRRVMQLTELGLIIATILDKVQSEKEIYGGN